MKLRRIEIRGFQQFRTDSSVLEQGLVYRPKGDNRPLKNLLLAEQRRLRGLFDELGWSAAQKRAYLAENPKELSFITALERALDLPLHDLVDGDAG